MSAVASAHDQAAGRTWRIPFLLIHLAFMVLSVVALVSTARQRTLTYAIDWGLSSDQFGQLMLVDRWGTFGRLSLLAAGIYLAALIARGDVRVPKYCMWYGGVLLAFDALLNLAQLQLWGIPRGTSWGAYVLVMGATAVALLGWVVYVSRSRKVRRLFSLEPRVMGPVGRLLIGLVAVALIMWPFILTALVEPTVGLAAAISPKDASAGSGLAEGILLMSVVTGLFVLMKNVWRMQNVWIAVLLPASFAALFLTYGMLAFVGYYRF